MENLTKSQIRSSFMQDMGQLLWEERQKNRLSLDKMMNRCSLSRGVIDRIEIGRCHDIHLIFCLCAVYGKRIKVELAD